jgi:hypothetical protein
MKQNIQYSPLEEFVLKPSVENYEVNDAWTIFNEFSLTTLNRLPVSILDSWVTARINYTDAFYEITPYDISESLIVDGTVVILEGALLHRDCYVDAPNDELLIRKMDEGITRVYTKNLSSWLVTDVVGYGTEKEKTVATSVLPEEDLYIYINGYGILYPHQFTYRRLEEIEYAIRTQTSEMALSIIVSGYEGADTKKTKQEIRGGARILFVPGTGVEVHRVGDSNVSNQLLADFQNLLPLYMKALHVPMSNENKEQSGISRQLEMQDAIKYVTETRKHLSNIWNDIKGGPISFGSITILSADERTAELDYYSRLRNEGVISIEEYTKMVRETLV